MLSQWQNETDSSGADASNLPNQSGQNLSTFIVNYFHGPNGMSCPIITDGICNSPIGCVSLIAANSNRRSDCEVFSTDKSFDRASRATEAAWFRPQRHI